MSLKEKIKLIKKAEVKGRDLPTMIHRLDDWLGDGRVVKSATLHVDESKAYSHTLYIEELDGYIPIREVEKIVYKEKIVYVDKEDMYKNINNLFEFRKFLDLRAGEFAWELGLTRHKSIRELHIRTLKTRRVYALKISDIWGVDFDQALDWVSKGYNSRKGFKK